MTPVFRMLGTVQVNGPGGSVRIRSLRERTILAILAVNYNQVVSVSRLIDAVWGENPPDTARSQIHICLSNLRSTLHLIGVKERIRTQSPGYLLSTREGELDLQIFDSELSKGLDALASRAPAAVRSLRSTIRMCSDTPFADVENTMVRSHATRVLDRKLSALEEVIGIEIERGDHQGVLGELSDLISLHPFRERLRFLQMSALWKAGRRSDALSAYREARRDIVDEFGIEPGSELQALHQEFLEDDRPAGDSSAGGRLAPHGKPTRTVAQMLPPSVADFSGRSTEMDWLHKKVHADHSARGCPSRPVLLVISGGAGTGKTTLALQLAHDLTREFDEGQFFASFTEREDASAGALAGFLQAVNMSPAACSDMSEQADRFRNSVAGRRIVVVLDDVRDEAQVLPLLPGRAPCVVVVTSRHRLGGLPGAARLDLKAPPAEEAVGILERMLNDERVGSDPGVALELVERVERLPLALRSISGRLHDRPHWTLSRMEQLYADDGDLLRAMAHAGRDVGERIMRDHDRLDPAAQELLARLAHLDRRDFSLAEIPGLLHCEPDGVTESLEILGEHQFVEVRSTCGRTRYRIPLITQLVVRQFWAARTKRAGVPGPSDGALHPVAPLTV